MLGLGGEVDEGSAPVAAAMRWYSSGCLLPCSFGVSVGVGYGKSGSGPFTVAEKKGNSGSGPLIVAEVKVAKVGEGGLSRGFGSVGIGGAADLGRAVVSSTALGEGGFLVSASISLGTVRIPRGSCTSCLSRKCSGEGLADDTAGGGDIVPNVISV